MAKNECRACAWEEVNAKKIDFSVSNVLWAERVGVSETAIRRHRKHQFGRVFAEPLPANAKWEVSGDEFDGMSPASVAALDVDDVEQFILSKGLNPDDWDYQWKFSEWEQASKAHGVRTLNAFKVWGKRKKNSINIDTILADIDKFEWTPTTRKIENGVGDSLIVLATDFQLGKTDWNGGTDNTIAQVIESFCRVRDIALEQKVDEIVVVDAGDIIENFYNTSSQRQTNDLSLPKQVLAAYKLMIRGLYLLATDTTCVIKYVAVPSNHSRDRMGMQAPAGDVHDDWGIIIAKLIEETTDIEVIVPDDYHDSVSFLTANTGIGVVHGHQAGSADKIGNWWQGQSHGEMPTQHADILVTGHFHSLRVQQSGNKKWVIVGSASDRGSSWFTNNRGEQSISGITCFTVRDGMWSNLQIV